MSSCSTNLSQSAIAAAAAAAAADSEYRKARSDLNNKRQRDADVQDITRAEDRLNRAVQAKKSVAKKQKLDAIMKGQAKIAEDTKDIRDKTCENV